MDTLRFVKQRCPKTGCFENVANILQAPDSEKSPAQFVIEELEKMDYSVCYREVCLSLFHTAQRKRPVSLS